MSTLPAALCNLEYGYRKLAKTRYIYVAETDRCGFGIFAAKTFLSGQLILKDDDGDYYDEAIAYAQVAAMGIDMARYCFQVDYDQFLLPHGSIDDLINHSCRPNVGIRLTSMGYDLIAMSDINLNDELTYDYSTYIASPEQLSCSCGAACCRRQIGCFTDLDPQLQAYYIGWDVVERFVRADRAAAVGGGRRRAAR
jgi:hypothetical protein